MSVLDETWRCGTKTGRCLYRGDGPDDLIGVLDTREAARLAAEAPAMLRMLKARQAELASQGRGWPSLDALIARAEGRSDG